MSEHLYQKRILSFFSAAIITLSTSQGQLANEWSVDCGNENSEWLSPSGIKYQKDFKFPGRTFQNVNFNDVRDYDSNLYKNYCYGKNIEYVLELSNATYEVTLMFCEDYHQGPGRRTFDVWIEGQKVIPNLDIYKKAGHNKSYVTKHQIECKDGHFNLKLSAIIDNASISAFSVKPLHQHFTYDGNPLLRSQAGGDPDVKVWTINGNQEVWVYCSKDQVPFPIKEGNDDDVYASMDGYYAYSTNDLSMKQWKYHGEVFHSRDVSWGRKNGNMWAPSVAHVKDGAFSGYYLYYPTKDSDHQWCIGVAKSPNAYGPFKDQGKLFYEDSYGKKTYANNIDPMVFIDDDKQAYIYFNDHRVAKLDQNMTKLSSLPITINYDSGNNGVMQRENERFMEASFMHKYEGKYYFSWCNHTNKTSQLFYSIGDSPLGPFRFVGAAAGVPAGSAQMHQSIIRFNSKNYLFYHLQDKHLPAKITGQSRIASFDEFSYRAVQVGNNWESHINRIPLTAGPKAGSSFTPINLNCGGSDCIVSNGLKYVSDFGFFKGNTDNELNTSRISNTTDTRDEYIYQIFRHGDRLEYDIPVPAGKYEVTFMFHEPFFNGEEDRLMDIFCESSSPVRSNYSIRKAASAQNRAVDLVIPDRWVYDGTLDIDLFKNKEAKAILSGLRIRKTN